MPSQWMIVPLSPTDHPSLALTMHTENKVETVGLAHLLSVTSPAFANGRFRLDKVNKTAAIRPGLRKVLICKLCLPRLHFCALCNKCFILAERRPASREMGGLQPLLVLVSCGTQRQTHSSPTNPLRVLLARDA